MEAAKVQARLEERERAAYKGEDIAGASAVVQNVLDGPGPVFDAVVEGPLLRMWLRIARL